MTSRNLAQFFLLANAHTPPRHPQRTHSPRAIENTPPTVLRSTHAHSLVLQSITFSVELRRTHTPWYYRDSTLCSTKENTLRCYRGRTLAGIIEHRLCGSIKNMTHTVWFYRNTFCGCIENTLSMWLHRGHILWFYRKHILCGSIENTHCCSIEYIHSVFLQRTHTMWFYREHAHYVVL